MRTPLTCVSYSLSSLGFTKGFGRFMSVCALIFATSLFVINVPFKMMDKGVTLSYAGSDILEDGKKVEVIKGIYNPEKHANHTKPDTWWYYFDAKDSRMVAYFIKHDFNTSLLLYPV